MSRIPSLISPSLIWLSPELTTEGPSSLFDLLITSATSVSSGSKISSLCSTNRSISYAFCSPLCSMPKLSAIDLRSATGFDCNCDLADILSPI